MRPRERCPSGPADGSLPAARHGPASGCRSGDSAIASNRASPSGIRSACVAGGDLAGCGRIERAAAGLGQEARHRSAVDRVLVQPGMLSAGDPQASRRGPRRGRRRAPPAPPVRAGGDGSPASPRPRRRAPAGSVRGSGRRPPRRWSTGRHARAVGRRRGPSARPAGRRSGRGSAGGRGGTSGGSAGTGRTDRRSPRSQRPAGRRRRPGSPRWRPSSGPRSRRR